jgi:acyl-[acyl-carrier-protein]-phospholipid O-acyltransferase/long-chain-fatty-acid--[acyl-carrier-protein] ligase
MGAPELAVPRILIPVDEIPLLGTGKTDYVRLGAMAAEKPAVSVA